MNGVKIHRLILCLIILIVSHSCKKKPIDNGPPAPKVKATKFCGFKMLDDSTATMNGFIFTTAEDCFNQMTDEYPNLKLIILENCPGSWDEDVNRIISKKLRNLGIHTHIAENGVIESGAVGFFLSGINRTMDTSAIIGVHSWTTEQGVEAYLLPPNDPAHDPFIQHYVNIGFPSQEAEDFYFFTIHASPSTSIYYMSDTEIAHYKLLNP